MFGNFSVLEFDLSDLDSKILSQSRAVVFQPCWVLELLGDFFTTHLTSLAPIVKTSTSLFTAAGEIRAN